MMMRFALDALYAAALVLSSPMWLYRMVRHGRYRTDNAARFGAVPPRYGLQPVIWIHAVSLGEINGARSLVEELHAQLPDYRIVISTTTDTGMAAARKLYAPDHLVFRWPLDFSFAVARALRRIRPALVILMEGEVWPNFLAACNRRGIPVAIVNGRLSPDKGYPRYRKLGPIARALFNRLAAVGAQTEEYAQRYRALGVAADKVHVTGMLKFDTVHVSDHIHGQEALAGAVGLADGDRLLVAGGTGPGEEEILLDVYAKLREQHPDLRLALVPRKPERFDEVARLLAARGLPCIRRSQHPDGAAPDGPRDAVILGDTMGELRKFYSLSFASFVGRSLVPMGGSDMIEAAALGKPTAFGPHTFNFPQADDLASHGAARVPDADGLRTQLDAWLRDPASAASAAQHAKQYVVSQQGATRRNVAMLCRLLHRRPAISPGGIATDELAKA